MMEEWNNGFYKKKLKRKAIRFCAPACSLVLIPSFIVLPNLPSFQSSIIP